MRDEKPKITRGTRGTLTPVRRDRYKHSEWGGIARLSQKQWRGTGLKKPMLDTSLSS